MYDPVFSSKAMQAVVAMARRVAVKDIPVLLSGATGTGKEVIARIIHQTSPRSKQPFIPVNCAALPAELIESELFGSSKGAYTDAKHERKGLIEQAEKGTLMLDELNEMPSAMQAKLLRVLQDKKIRRVGSTQEQPVDFRLVAAINVDPASLVESGKLRRDLYYRINVITINIPPLCERKDDIEPLAKTFLDYYKTAYGYTEDIRLGDAAINLLKDYHWPGNVRQLENEINRLTALGIVGEITPTDFSDELSHPALPVANLSLMERTEAEAIRAALLRLKGNKFATCQHLGIGRQTLYNKILRYGIVIPRFSPRKRKPEPGENPAPVPTPSSSSNGNGDLKPEAWDSGVDLAAL